MAEDKTPSVHQLGMNKNKGGAPKKTKKGRKTGRNKLACSRYALEHRREKNKLRRLRRHLKKHSADLCAMTAADLCKVVLGIRA
jgi:hypothetical protein